MNIETKFLGEVPINEEEILTFENGLPGFPEEKKYILLGLDSDLPIALLQATENKELGFIVAYPYAFKGDYAFDLSEEDKEELKIESESDVAVYTVLTLKESFQQSTMNLLAPVVINKSKKLGKQIILQDSEQYPLRFQIAAEGSVK